MSNYENENNGFNPEENTSSAPEGNNTSGNEANQSANSYSTNSDPSANGGNPNMNSGSWVFSERQNQPNNGYNSKYSYSSYENSQNQQQNSYQNQNSYGNAYQNAQRQNSGPAYDRSAYSYNSADNKQDGTYRWNYEDYQSHQPKEPKKGKKNKGLKIFACILGGIVGVGVLVLAGFGALALIEGSDSYEGAALQEGTTTIEEVAPPTTEHNLTLTDRPEEETEILSDGKLTIPQRAEKVKASVVGIVNYQQSSSSYYTEESQGSGIIMSEDGYIITNAHVIEGAIGLKVVLSDGNEYSAQIVGSDSQTDLAVIKIEATGLTAAEFGNSDQLEVGEQLIAVGNPTGLELGGTLTVGYVSALNRQIDTTSGLNYIQTDAAINPGNSGGALANEYGQVIGINTAKISGDGYEGLGFAISINDAQPIIDDLINYGYVKGRVCIGISVYEIDAFTAQLNNCPQGIMVAGIESSAPVASSGLVPGDIITAIDGQSITAYEDVSAILEGKQPGDTIVATVFRRTTGYADKELNIEIELTESVETVSQVQNSYSSESGNSNNSGSQSNPYGSFGNYFGIN